MLFSRKQPKTTAFPPERFAPVVRRSICTGERTACMRDRASGEIFEIMLIRSPRDLADFARQYGVREEEIETIY